MPNKILLSQIEETSARLGLDEAVIEKDYYVTQVIHALSSLENEHFRLVFCGGTCLAKAYKLVKRMSEDVDFKIVNKSTSYLLRSEAKRALKNFKLQVEKTLTLSDFSIIENTTRNEGKYQQMILKYPRLFSIGSPLRPEIKVELTSADLLFPSKELSIKTLIEETLKGINLSIPSLTSCTCINETAIEKWVSLTRRIVAIDRGYEQDDETLIRHVYDLNAIYPSSNSIPILSAFVKQISSSDGQKYKNQHPEYMQNPLHEISQSLTILKNKSLWKERYGEFIEAMIYDPHHPPVYDEAISQLTQISARFLEKF